MQHVGALQVGDCLGRHVDRSTASSVLPTGSEGGKKPPIHWLEEPSESCKHEDHQLFVAAVSPTKTKSNRPHSLSCGCGQFCCAASATQKTTPEDEKQLLFVIVCTSLLLSPLETLMN